MVMSKDKSIVLSCQLPVQTKVIVLNISIIYSVFSLYCTVHLHILKNDGM